MQANAADLIFKEADDGFVVSSSNPDVAGDLVIPESHNGKPVVAIGNRAFWRRGKLRSVVLPPTLKRIEKHAFAGCVALANVEFPESLESIGESAFESCSSLVDIELPEGLREIGYKAFAYCSARESILAPDSVEWIGEGAFDDASYAPNLTLVVDENSVAEQWCLARKRRFKHGVVKFLRWEERNGGVSILGVNDLPGRPKELALPRKIKRAPVVSIAERAFAGLSDLEKIVLPPTVVEIGKAAFARMTQLREIVVSPENRAFKVVDGALRSADGKRLLAFPTAQRVDALAFSSELEVVEEEAFAGADVQRVAFSEGLRALERASFQNCARLETIEPPTTLETIGDDAFAGDDKIEFFMEPRALVAVGKDAFSPKTELCVRRNGALDRWAKAAARDVLYNLEDEAIFEAIDDGLELVGLKSPQTVEGRARLPEKVDGRLVRAIRSGAFSGSRATVVFLPPTLGAIAEGAFADTPFLEKIDFSVASAAFVAKDGVLYSPTGVLLAYPSAKAGDECRVARGVSRIGSRAFDRAAFKLARIPATTREIADDAFDGCAELQRFVVDPDNAQYDSRDGALCSNDDVLIKYPRGKRDEVFVATDGIATIGARAFYGARFLRELDLPSSVVAIDEEAFAHCDALESALIPTSVKKISGSAFDASPNAVVVSPQGSFARRWCELNGRRWKRDVSPYFARRIVNGGAVLLAVREELFDPNYFDGALTIPKRVGGAPVTAIGEKIFRNNDRLTSVVVPRGVKQIMRSAFKRCVNLRSIDLPDTLEVVGYRAFKQCASLESVDLSGGVRIIDRSAFNACENLRSVQFGAALELIGNDAFRSCKSLETLEIPSSVSSIGDGAFSDCESLRSAIIREGVSELGEGVFYLCASLKSIVIPSTIKSIGKGVFWNCRALESVKLSDEVLAIGEFAFRNCESLASFPLPARLREIGCAAFQKCSARDFSVVAIPGSVKTIADRAFKDCKSLAAVSIAEGVEEIGARAFQSCDALASFNLPTTLRRVGEFAFALCHSLGAYAPRIEIPASLIQIEKCAFGACDKIETFVVDPSNPVYFEFNGALYTREGVLICWPAGKIERETCVIPENTTALADYSFFGARKIKQIVLPNSVRSVGEFAFRRAILGSITLPATIESIGQAAFRTRTVVRYFPGCKVVLDWLDENVHMNRAQIGG